jgi:ATP-dependent helicase HrpB
MVGGRGVKLSEESAVSDPELFIAIEFIDTGQPESLVKLASGVEKEWLPPTHLKTAIEIEYDLDREKVMAWRRLRFCDLLLSEAPTAVPPDTDVSSVLAEALANKADLETLVDEQAHSYLARVERLRECAPELDLPDFGPTPWYDLLPEWCAGMNSVAELRSTSLISAIQARLTRQQIIEIEHEMPEKISIPSGRKVTVEYKRGQPPVLAARIQELFGLTETPKIGRSRVTVLLHLLAPNYRIQQITPDLTSFWKNTYPDIKKELKGRYPKHQWPDDPTKPLPDRYPNKKS